MTERGSISLVTAASLAFAVVLAALGADLSRAATAALRVQGVADAAALAAAQELVRPSARSPAQVAAEYAEAGGARVVACRCRPRGGDVVVEVAAEVTLPFLGVARTVRRTARAVALAPAGDPRGTEGLVTWFAERLGCLFGRVPGLVLVSGFRTREEQARLHREKPHLAAPPGRSMHELGLAADLGYPSAFARDAAHRAAPSCGLRFPVPHEPWHAEPAP